MTTIYSYNADSRQMKIFARDKTNNVIATLEDIDVRTSHQIQKAIDRLYEDGLREGKTQVLAAVNRAVDQITV